MKYKNNLKLVRLPASTFFAPNSILLSINIDIMTCESPQSIPKGSEVIAHQIQFEQLQNDKEYVVTDIHGKVYIGKLVTDVKCGLTILPYNNKYPGIFLHKVLISEIYLVTEVIIKRGLWQFTDLA